MAQGVGEHIAQALAALRASQAAQRRAITALEMGLQKGIKPLPEPSAPPCDHRREHRRGSPSKLVSDDELRAFVLARIETLTFDQVVRAVAESFPPHRRISRSSLHRWWHRTGKHNNSREQR